MALNELQKIFLNQIKFWKIKHVYASEGPWKINLVEPPKSLKKSPIVAL